MAERKTGPVKPPTIDLAARSADTDAKAPLHETPLPETDRSAAEPVKPASASAARPPEIGAPKPSTATSSKLASEATTSEAKPKPQKTASRALVAGIAGAVAGGLLGLGAAYGLATLGFWPGTANSVDRAALVALSEEVDAKFVARNDVGAVVDKAIGELRSDVSKLGDRIASLETATPADSGPAVQALGGRIAALESGLTSLGKTLDAATIAGGDPAASEGLTRIEGEFAAVTTRLSALEGRASASPDSIAALDTALQSLKTEVGQIASGLAALQALPAPQPVDLRLPLALNGLSEALDTGAPFAAELALVRAVLPALVVPDLVADAASAGLGSPGDLIALFEARVPDMLAARPVDHRAGWVDQALEKLKALVALRPVATAGDTSPDALIGRVEAALAARDFAAAAASMAALPEPMRAASTGTAAKIAQFGALADFVSSVRTTALARAGEAS